MQGTHAQRSTAALPLVGRLAWLVTAALLVAAVLATSSRAHAASSTATEPNTAIKWNEIASTAILATAAQPPHVGVLGLAMVQGAVYDAVNAIDGGHDAYLVKPAAKSGDSKEAAAATAAYRVLVGFPNSTPAVIGLVPTQLATLQPLFEASLATVPDGSSKTGGRAAGRAAAAAMLTSRQGDGRGGSFTFTPGTDPGDWRPGPPQGPSPGIVAQDPAPWVGSVRPFLVPNVGMLRTAGPNALRSEAYEDDFNEVKRVGSLTSTKRTTDQTAASIFWQDNGAAIWNRVFRSLALTHDLDIVDSARLLAMTNLAAADGSIGCWNDKAYWSFWRPITAIREAGSDGNPETKADPDWVPLFDPSVAVSGLPLVTPGFPDHPSGHSCVSSAIVHTMQDFFGTDNVPFTATSNKCLPAPCPSRSFARLSDALKEIINARVWSGIHFRTADVQGAQLGTKVADYLAAHYFEPTS
jgi:PAP2 superfamily